MTNLTLIDSQTTSRSNRSGETIRISFCKYWLIPARQVYSLREIKYTNKWAIILLKILLFLEKFCASSVIVSCPDGEPVNPDFGPHLSGLEPKFSKICPYWETVYSGVLGAVAQIR